MNPPQKITQPAAGVASVVALFLFTASALLAQEATKEKRVALLTADGKYISTAANGGLDLSGKSAGDKTVFVLIDLNSGDLADGDEVKIKYLPGHSADAGKNKPSFWVEEADKVKRTNVEPQGATGKFKLKKQGEGFVLQAADQKFVAAPTEGGLGLADKLEGGLTLKIEEQPAAQ